MKKKVTNIHAFIKKLTPGAIARKDINSCDRQPDDSYIITSSDGVTLTHNPNGAGTFLYLLDSLSKA